VSVIALFATTVVGCTNRLRCYPAGGEHPDDHEADKSGRLAALLSLMLLGSCSTLPRDAKLKQIFYGNRDDFNRLVQMSAQDPQLTRIDFDFTDSGPRKNVGLSEDRWQQYRVLFQKLGLTDGLGRSTETPPTIFFYVQCEGSAIDGDCKGLAYSEKPFVPVKNSLDRMPPDGTFFETLSPNWYLFRMVS
jgi:hypothetical protein